MISLNPQRVHEPQATERLVRRFGPWPWYLSAADFIGLDTEMVDGIAGDLVEACAGASGMTGLLRRAWCAGQILRAIPYLAISTVRRGHPRARLRLMNVIATLMFIATLAFVATQLHVGPPARIAADRGFNASDIVINNFEFVQMPIHALDARGHVVPKAGIRYERVSGARIELSPSGAVSCGSAGDAVVRASVNGVTSLVTVHCRPVTGIRTSAWHDFLPGDQPKTLYLEAVDPYNKVVDQLRGSVRVEDPNVATLHQNTLTPQGVGSTRLNVVVGDVHLSVAVVVHEIVSGFDNLSAMQRNVAMPLRLSTGDTLHLGAPDGTIWVKWMSRDGTSAHPDITAEGTGYCHAGSEQLTRWLPPGETYGAYCYMGEGARIRVSRGKEGVPVIHGALLLERVER